MNNIRRAIALSFIGLFCLCACSSEKAASRQPIYKTPDEAADALIDAMRRNDKGAELKILGPAAEPLMHSGDAVADEDARKHFLALYDTHHEFKFDEQNREVLILGHQEWPMPIPLVRAGGGWRFDTAAGKEEILNRRIGRNELNVIQVCHAYVEAQREYAATHFTHGLHEYAQHFISKSGKRDGLYWPVKNGEKESPLGPFIAAAASEGYSDKDIHFTRAPYHGYYFRILTQQGNYAHGGIKTYFSDKKHMTQGFALIAWPARYGDSGVMTFIVNQYGIVYQKDLGPNTTALAPSIYAFDPDPGWSLP